MVMFTAIFEVCIFHVPALVSSVIYLLIRMKSGEGAPKTVNS